MSNETDDASALEAIDYLIDDVVADAYVRGAEGLSTEVSPKSAATLHAAVAQALQSARAQGVREGMERAATFVDPPLMHRKGPIGIWRRRRAEIAAAIRSQSQKE